MHSLEGDILHETVSCPISRRNHQFRRVQGNERRARPDRGMGEGR